MIYYASVYPSPYGYDIIISSGYRKNSIPIEYSVNKLRNKSKRKIKLQYVDSQIGFMENLCRWFSINHGKNVKSYKKTFMFGHDTRFKVGFVVRNKYVVMNFLKEWSK